MPVTDEVWRLDTEEDADCLFFQKMSDHGHYGKLSKGKSRQGTYVFTPDGEFLASINDLSADRTLAMIERGLKKWEQLPDSRKQAKPSKSIKPRHRWEHFYPRDGLVLNIYSRDLPESADPAIRLATRNRDTAWFSKSEVATMIPAAAKAGDTFEFPSAFVQRMLGFHFVDCVKGQTEPFSKSQTASSRIAGEVTRLDDQNIELTLSGKTLGRVERGRFPRGVRTDLMGRAVFDKKSRSFSEFEMVAVGERWGRTRFNGRHRQLDATPIGFVFQLAPPDATASIPGIIWAYNAPWLEGPKHE